MRPAPWPFGCAPLGAVLPAGGPSRTRAFETPVTLAMGTTVPTSSLELFTIVRAEAAERGADLPPVFVPLVMLVLQGLESDDLPRWLQGQVAGSPVRCGV